MPEVNVTRAGQGLGKRDCAMLPGRLMINPVGTGPVAKRFTIPYPGTGIQCVQIKLTTVGSGGSSNTSLATVVSEVSPAVVEVVRQQAPGSAPTA